MRTALVVLTLLGATVLLLVLLSQRPLPTPPLSTAGACVAPQERTQGEQVLPAAAPDDAGFADPSNDRVSLRPSGLASKAVVAGETCALQIEIQALPEGSASASRVEIDSLDSKLTQSKMLDERGQVSFNDLPPGRWRVIAVIPIPEQQSQVCRFVRKRVDLESGETNRVVVQLSDLVLVNGLVTISGLPAPDLNVTYAGTGSQGSVITDADGSFVLEYLPLGDYFFQFGEAPGTTLHQRHFEEDGPTAACFDLPSNRVEVLVVERGTARPMGQAVIGLETIDPDPEFEPPSRIDSDFNGHAAFVYIPNGRWQLFAKPGGSPANLAFATAVVPGIRLGGGTDASFVLPVEPGARVHVLAVDEQGTPIPNARVYWRDSRGILLTADAFDASTDSEGHTLLRTLPLGAGSIVVNHFSRGRGEAGVELVSGEDIDVKVELRPLTEVCLRFVDDGGEPTEPLVLRWVRDAHGSLQPFEARDIESSEAGILRLGGLPSGRQTFGFWRPWGGLYQRTFEIPDSSEAVVLEVRVQH